MKQINERIRKNFTERFPKNMGFPEARVEEDGEFTTFYFPKRTGDRVDSIWNQHVWHTCRLQILGAGLGVEWVGRSTFLSDDPNFMAIVVRFPSEEKQHDDSQS